VRKDPSVSNNPSSNPTVSVVVPARNAECLIAVVVSSVFGQHRDEVLMEVIVVDDGSTDRTAEEARRAGARVLNSAVPGQDGNPAAARNLGAREAVGDLLIFLDADCVPREGWLDAILAAHARGESVVGGSLELPPGLPLTARCDYYCGWYHVHPDRTAGEVPHHPPPNLSVIRDVFRSTSGFTAVPPMKYTNEERAWQGQVRRSGHRIYFEPGAVALHYNRPGFGNLLRRNYRWGYTAIESKSKTGAARWEWMYRMPRLLIAASPLLAMIHTAYIVSCWVRAGRYEPLLMLPAVLISRFAYAFGMAVGGTRWIRQRRLSGPAVRTGPRWV
jgi:glycosyltransferase involved in cell wall biosynthesis